ncbi:hypothetical protein CANCADRAFT_112033 [Tortispora caseinolytica NRRL Y-17796]|uniref:SEC14 homolog 3 n=1 Tax=Tortispora caseinolytica NRRL Y-17796 TaxID=767744 RepID=A0A1E4TGE6_9ASCO|nr:hypothetical protein CANCADRAFT_112033 [Tortispora caseinolytica NRRL Y-17796]
MPLSTPIEFPPEGLKAPEPAPLTKEQESKYETVLAYCQKLREVPVNTSKNADKAPLTDTEKAWITRECILRYLRATKWKVEEAESRIVLTLAWRREFGVEDLDEKEMGIENETGKEVILGYDVDARPCLYLVPGRQNTPKSDRQIQHLVFMLERVIDFMPPGQDALALLIEFKNSSNSKNPSVGQGRQVLHILQTHYPERLGKAMVVNIPWFVWTFLKIIWPFIDPLTREKLVFSEPLRNYVDPKLLDRNFGGDLDFEYVHEKYWPALLEMAKKKREQYLQRWKALGSVIGTSEYILRSNTPIKESSDELNTVSDEKDEVADLSSKADDLAISDSS